MFFCGQEIELPSAKLKTDIYLQFIFTFSLIYAIYPMQNMLESIMYWKRIAALSCASSVM